MDVTEIFTSLQGETTRVGVPCVFVRLAGCDLRCAWCDTTYAWDGGTPMDTDAIVAAVDAAGAGVRLACVTGGEPMLQDGTPDLLARLLATGREVMLMTSGARPLDRVPAAVVKALDVKTPWVHGEGAPSVVRRPSSPEAPPHLDPANLACLTRRDEAKFVVGTREEFDWACAWAASVGLFDRVGTVLAGAVWGRLEPAELADWILASGLPIRLNVQVHKRLWGAGTRR